MQICSVNIGTASHRSIGNPVASPKPLTHHSRTAHSQLFTYERCKPNESLVPCPAVPEVPGTRHLVLVRAVNMKPPTASRTGTGGLIGVTSCPALPRIYRRSWDGVVSPGMLNGGFPNRKRLDSFCRVQPYLHTFHSHSLTLSPSLSISLSPQQTVKYDSELREQGRHVEQSWNRKIGIGPSLTATKPKCKHNCSAGRSIEPLYPRSTLPLPSTNSVAQ